METKNVDTQDVSYRYVHIVLYMKYGQEFVEDFRLNSFLKDDAALEESVPFKEAYTLEEASVLTVQLRQNLTDKLLSNSGIISLNDLRVKAKDVSGYRYFYS